jgi:RND family efflux transporter MFP subunit
MTKNAIRRRGMLNRCLLGAVAIAGLLGSAGGAATAGELMTAVVQSPGSGDSASFDGVVEAVRQTVVSAQVPGAIVAIEVKVGDLVKSGQVLARIDARAAEQGVAASDALVRSARATLEVSTKEFDRQRQLFEKKYTSQAALDRAEALYKATQAQVSAQLAQAGAARAQSGFFVVKAPYGGVVADVPVMLGDMAMPGRPLLTIYDPAALRVTAAVPQSALARLAPGKPIKIQFSGLPADRQWAAPARVTLLPTADPGTHTTEIRLDLASGDVQVTPGTFARVWLPVQGAATPRLYVPATAIVRRAEMTGVYVIDSNGHPVLRQVRLGRGVDETIEILSGVTAGERVAIDPQAASREH